MTMKLIYTCCPLCHQEGSVAVNDKGYDDYIAGKPIAEALPKLTESQREMLVSGLCHDCWNNFFPEE